MNKIHKRRKWNLKLSLLIVNARWLNWGENLFFYWSVRLLRHTLSCLMLKKLTRTDELFLSWNGFDADLKPILNANLNSISSATLESRFESRTGIQETILELIKPFSVFHFLKDEFIFILNSLTQSDLWNRLILNFRSFDFQKSSLFCYDRAKMLSEIFFRRFWLVPVFGQSSYTSNEEQFFFVKFKEFKIQRIDDFLSV